MHLVDKTTHFFRMALVSVLPQTNPKDKGEGIIQDVMP